MKRDYEIHDLSNARFKDYVKLIPMKQTKRIKTKKEKFLHEKDEEERKTEKIGGACVLYISAV